MTITAFWKLASAFCHTASLAALNADHLEKYIVVGIDAMIWIVKTQAAFHKPHHSQNGESPELRTLFYKLAAFQKSGAIAVFVFDGPNKAKVKRGKTVRSKPHWLVSSFQDLIKAFGYYHHQAPGEGEAELAYMNARREVDMVYTDDGDVFAFGGVQIFRTYVLFPPNYPAR
ncbi:PIN domain-like protein [Mycena kentingensis (nom. inval.)]|nr:PIN domain-like protein [Mycena kentingensis (nom. inval.)]